MAHRGGAIEHVENSMPAFEACVAMGYRYLETDVRVTADGVPIVFHDPTLDRVTDRTGRVDQLPWTELASTRIGGREPILPVAGASCGLPAARVHPDTTRRPPVAPLVLAGPPAGARESVWPGALFDPR